MINISVLIVIYNKPLSKSLTFQSIKDFKGLDIIIADNSTSDFDNEIVAKDNGLCYISMNGNAGLSKAYNKVIDTLDKNNDILCLFDDDTCVGHDYFKILKSDADQYPEINLFAPIVRDSKGLISPCLINGVRVRRIKSVKNISDRGISVINSGLAIRTKLFMNYRYDEGQFLDYIDHAFIRDTVGYNKAKICIMENVVLEQSFAGSDHLGKKADKSRFLIFKKDVWYFRQKYSVSRIATLIILFRRRMSLLIKYFIYQGENID